ncbi:MAG: DNA mismatch repair protein MutS [Chloroflexi bacterium]|nr:DNA mismatch repair protein MutS [Chloroflexota bacterium]
MTTPARRQYLDIKAEHPDALLLFRMGDFYELFDDDARVAARDLHITLTSREFGKGERTPMAGIPYHALDSYLARLVDRGHRVAICEQLSEAGKGLVDRGVVRVVTPGARSGPGLVRPKEHTYLVAVVRGRQGIGLAAVDVTEGALRVTQLSGPGAAALLDQELARLAPAECLVPTGQADQAPAPVPAGGAGRGAPMRITPLDDGRFEPEAANEALCRRFGVGSLEGFGCAGLPLAVGAAAAIAAYLERTDRGLAGLLRPPQTYAPGDFMALDAAARRNLELARSAREGDGRASLLAVLDHTRTPMGGRLLRSWLGQPLLERAPLNARLDAVAALAGDAPLRGLLDTPLRSVGDLERLTNRIRAALPTPRDLPALVVALEAVQVIRHQLSVFRKRGTEGDEAALCALLAENVVHLDSCDKLAALVRRAMAAEPAGGRAIAAGFDEELDRLAASIAESQAWLAGLERAERERTGIKSLKVGYNKVFGFYIEVTRPNLALVPPEYERRQTVAGGERYFTGELKAHESAVLNAEEAIRERERAVLCQLQAAVEQAAPRLLTTAGATAELDVLLSLAQTAAERGYVRPELTDEPVLDIRDGRHPVVEAAHGAGEFVPNDCRMDAREGQNIAGFEGGCALSNGGDAMYGVSTEDDACVPRLLMITGPNMAGKSTYLRQTALILLLAQIGSFVPARSARIGLADRIFTRIGAQDDITAGASTFMVEMAETANILRHATRRSLVLVDEVGRGTSTYDGLAVAQAVAEHLHSEIGCRTLFATHYQELTALADELPGVANARMAVADEGGRIAFLYRVEPGAADRSYGLHVARLAGLPERVAERAAHLLARFEAGAADCAGSGEGAALGAPYGAVPPDGDAELARQLTFFGVPSPQERARAAVDDLLRSDLTALSPAELLARLLEAQGRAVASRW